MVTGETGKEPEIENFSQGRAANCRSRARHYGVVRANFWRIKATTPYFRRIATRYDKLAGNFVSALCLVAVVANWL